MEFPELHGDPLIDCVIKKCWYNEYASIAELAAYIETLSGRRNRRETVANDGEPKGLCRDTGRNCSSEDFSSKKTFCQSLEKRGLLDMLSSGEPEQLGFNFKWYRYTT